jgi:negative regulator of flagellin synthesis FlgM
MNAPHAPFRGTAGANAPESLSVDSIDISAAAEAAVQAAESGEVRQGLVDRIRNQIAEGTYETPDKLDWAVERLLDEIG